MCSAGRRNRWAKDCFIDVHAFDGCSTVYVFAPEGGITQARSSASAVHCRVLAG